MPVPSFHNQAVGEDSDERLDHALSALKRKSSAGTSSYQPQQPPEQPPEQLPEALHKTTGGRLVQSDKQVQWHFSLDVPLITVSIGFSNESPTVKIKKMVTIILRNARTSTVNRLHDSSFSLSMTDVNINDDMVADPNLTSLLSSNTQARNLADQHDVHVRSSEAEKTLDDLESSNPNPKPNPN